MLERVYIEIGNICNLACSFCTGTTRPKRQMSTVEFSHVLKKVEPYTKYIYLHVMGEPLLHPKLDEFLRIAKEYSLPVCITTNGTLLSKKGKIIIESDAVHKVSISLHAPEGNGIIDLNDYLRCTVEFSKEAAEKGIYTVFRLWNGDSTEGLGKNSQNLQIENYLRREFPEEWQVRPKGYRLSKNIFLEYDGVFTWPTDSKADENYEGFCYGLSGQIAILADGQVVPCCLDANGEIPLGNIFEKELYEILDGERAVKIRQGFASGKVVDPLCQKCTFARKFKKRNN